MTRTPDGHDGRREASVVRPVGELDLGATAGLDRLLGGVPADIDVVVDLSRATFVDSAVLSLLVRGARRHSDQGSSLVLAAPAPFVRRVLTTTRLDDVLRCTDSVADARILLRQGGSEGPPDPLNPDERNR
jgi:anti-sigma B factor antagonist